MRDKRLALSYATPDGPQTIYLGGKPLSPERRASSAAGDVAPAACDGILALSEARNVTIRAPRSPVFSTPQIRQDPLRVFSAGTDLTVVEVSGAWYIVRWQGDRGPQTGYLHCSDATVYELAK